MVKHSREQDALEADLEVWKRVGLPQSRDDVHLNSKDKYDRTPRMYAKLAGIDWVFSDVRRLPTRVRAVS